MVWIEEIKLKGSDAIMSYDEHTMVKWLGSVSDPGREGGRHASEHFKSFGRTTVLTVTAPFGLYHTLVISHITTC